MYPKRDHNFDNYPYEGLNRRAWDALYYMYILLRDYKGLLEAILHTHIRRHPSKKDPHRGPTSQYPYRNPNETQKPLGIPAKEPLKAAPSLENYPYTLNRSSCKDPKEVQARDKRGDCLVPEIVFGLRFRVLGFRF